MLLVEGEPSVENIDQRRRRFVSKSFTIRQPVVSDPCYMPVMQTQAKVILIRRGTGMVLAETVPGSVTVFELLGGNEISSGDIIMGNLEELDNQEFYNITKDDKLNVFVHEAGCELHDAIERHFAQLSPLEPPRRPMWPIRRPASIR